MTSTPENNPSGQDNLPDSVPVFDQFDLREADLEIVNGDLPEDVPELRNDIHPDDSWPAQVKREHDGGNHEHCAHSKHNRKHDRFAHGHDKAREILLQMRENVDTIGDLIHKGNKKGHMHTVPLAAAVSSYGILALPLVITGFGIHYANKLMMKHYHGKLTESLNALDVCENPKATTDEKQKAYDLLVLKGVRSVRNLEHFQGEKEKLAMGIVKSSVSFSLDLLCDVLGPVKLVKTFVETGIDSVIEHHEKKKVKPSESLLGALCLMRDGMEGVHNPHRPRSLLQKFAYSVIDLFKGKDKNEHRSSKPGKTAAPAHDQAA